MAEIAESECEQKNENISQNSQNEFEGEIVSEQSADELKEEAEKLKEKANEFFKSTQKQICFHILLTFCFYLVLCLFVTRIIFQIVMIF